jgi:hypothetical protein
MSILIEENIADLANCIVGGIVGKGIATQAVVWLVVWLNGLAAIALLLALAYGSVPADLLKPLVLVPVSLQD